MRAVITGKGVVGGLGDRHEARVGFSLGSPSAPAEAGRSGGDSIPSAHGLNDNAPESVAATFAQIHTAAVGAGGKAACPSGDCGFLWSGATPVAAFAEGLGKVGAADGPARELHGIPAPVFSFVCAWCVVEALKRGQVVVEPTGPVTHGVCPRHAEVLRAEMNSMDWRNL